jgi:hypothetical protein
MVNTFKKGGDKTLSNEILPDKTAYNKKKHRHPFKITRTFMLYRISQLRGGGGESVV